MSRFFSLISGSTWGYPIVGAIHVLALALFGGAFVVSNFSSVEDARLVRIWKWFALGLVTLSGLLLFASNAARYSASVSFRVKLVLLILIALNGAFFPRTRRRAYISAALWIAVIFASRGIAFF